MKNVMKHYGTAQQKKTNAAIERLNEAKTADARIAILNECNYYTLRGVVRKIGLTFFRKPFESEMRATLIDIVKHLS